MSRDIIDSFRAGDELTADLVDAILRELKRLRKMTAAPPLAITNAEGLSPPVISLSDQLSIVPFQAAALCPAAADIDTPESFTANLLMDDPSVGFKATSPYSPYNPVPTANGQNFSNVAIPDQASGWAIWRAGYLWPISWDSAAARMAKTSASGIPARSGTTPGHASDVTLYTLTADASTHVGTITATSTTVHAYNLSATAVGASKYIILINVDGLWVVDFEDC